MSDLIDLISGEFYRLGLYTVEGFTLQGYIVITAIPIVLAIYNKVIDSFFESNHLANRINSEISGSTSRVEKSISDATSEFERSVDDLTTRLERSIDDLRMELVSAIESNKSN